MGIELELGGEGLFEGGEGLWGGGDAGQALPVNWTLWFPRTQGLLGDSEHGEAWFIPPETEKNNFIETVLHYTQFHYTAVTNRTFNTLPNK